RDIAHWNRPVKTGWARDRPFPRGIGERGEGGPAGPETGTGTPATSPLLPALLPREQRLQPLLRPAAPPLVLGRPEQPLQLAPHAAPVLVLTIRVSRRRPVQPLHLGIRAAQQEGRL